LILSATTTQNVTDKFFVEKGRHFSSFIKNDCTWIPFNDTITFLRPLNMGVDAKIVSLAVLERNHGRKSKLCDFIGPLAAHLKKKVEKRHFPRVDFG
jgi:hypothetical protein